jgi:hypothetical protein
MPHDFQRIRYDELTSRQKENFNFQKISAVLADYGFATIRLSDDWCGADFIAQHVDGLKFLKVQLKGRLVFYQKYEGRELHIAFPCGGQWFIYPHDELLPHVLQIANVSRTYANKRGYSFPTLSRRLRELLEPYRLVLHNTAIDME